MYHQSNHRYNIGTLDPMIIMLPELSFNGFPFITFNLFGAKCICDYNPDPKRIIKCQLHFFLQILISIYTELHLIRVLEFVQL